VHSKNTWILVTSINGFRLEKCRAIYQGDEFVFLMKEDGVEKVEVSISMSIILWLIGYTVPKPESYEQLTNRFRIMIRVGPWISFMFDK
jgi:hypothetical protein